MIAEAIFTVLLAAVLLPLADLLICKMNKDRHGGDNSALRWVYHLRRYSIPIPDFYLSTYYAKTSNMKSKIQFCCLDDPVLKQIAEDFDDMFHRKSESFKAACLLAMVQQNVKYLSDLRRFDENDIWVFPIRTLEDKVGDCEDSAFLYCGIGTLIGLDVAIVRLVSHMVPAVHLDRCKVFDWGYYYKDKMYYTAETTSAIPILGLKYKYKTLLDMDYPMYPTDSFLRSIHRFGYIT